MNRVVLPVVLDGFAGNAPQDVLAGLLAGLQWMRGTGCAWQGQAEILPLVVPRDGLEL